MDWELTPPAVQDYIRPLRERVSQLEKQVETLPGRVEKTSQTSSKPPSSDSPFQKPKRTRQKSGGKRGAQKGHPGTGPKLLTPTAVPLIEPGPCVCGHGQLVSLTPSYTQQVIDLPPIEMDITPLILGYPFSPGHFAPSITYRNGLTALPGPGQLVDLR
jgi:transposase